jgi:serine/threonine-protein kinase
MLRDPRWQRIDDLYHAALQHDASGRQAFLRSECGEDEALRREVESLLAEDPGDAFLETPALEVAARDLASAAHTLIGRHLGDYHVLSLLGSGGMGEVYRARDTKLQRDVAIKVLPSTIAGDAAAVARFAREARLLAALNHPRIAAIYGVIDVDDTPAIVLELVDGETLATRIERGPLPIRDAIAIATQIADGLGAAHERGIVHRDLKPSNISLRPDGTVKILDFGLAKALVPVSSEPDALIVHASTATRVGVISGTPAYMSPEQAQGRPVDRRTDVWAFGCVLYEMLTGRRAFPGASATDILPAVIASEPDWSALPGDLSPTVRQFLKRCLAKDVMQRVGDIHTIRLALEGAFDADDVQPSSEPPAQRRISRRKILVGLGAAVPLAGSAVVAWNHARARATPGRVYRSEMALAANQRLFLSNIAHLIDVSPDGTQIVFASSGLWLRPLSSLDATLMPGTEDSYAHTPFFSPDGRWIGFYSVTSQELQRIAVKGGRPEVIASTPRPFGATWQANDRILFGRGSDGIWKVPVANGTPTQVIAVAEGEAAHSPRVLPDGRVMFGLRRRGVPSWAEGQVVAQARGSGTPDVLVAQGRDARYVSTGHLLYASADELLAVPFDAATGRVAGDQVRQMRGVQGPYLPFTDVSHFAVAAAGTLAYVPVYRSGPVERPLVWVAQDGTETPLNLGLVNGTGNVRVAPDGRHIAHASAGSVYVADASRPLWTPVVPGRGNGSVIWSRDGRDIAFFQLPDRLLRARADGTDVRQLLTMPGQQLLVPSTFTEDGRWLIFTYGTTVTSHVGLLDLTAADPRGPRWTTLTDGSTAALSPGDEWIAYQSSRTGEYHVYVDRFPNVGDPKPVSTTGGGGHPVWSRDGRELFYRRGDGAMMAVAVKKTPESIDFGTPVMLFPSNGYGTGPIAPAGGGRGWDLAPDGRFLLGKQQGPADTDDGTRIVIVQNWFEELRRQMAPA